MNWTDDFIKIAETFIIYRIRYVWHETARIYNEIAANYDSTMSMGFILLTISEADGTPVTKIAPRMGMEPNSLSRVLKTMEDRELIQRKRDATDKRKVFIHLTDKGRDMRKIALKAVFKVNNELYDTISNEKLAAFFEVINQIPIVLNKAKNGFFEEIAEEKINTKEYKE